MIKGCGCPASCAGLTLPQFGCPSSTAQLQRVSRAQRFRSAPWILQRDRSRTVGNLEHAWSSITRVLQNVYEGFGSHTRTCLRIYLQRGELVLKASEASVVDKCSNSRRRNTPRYRRSTGRDSPDMAGVQPVCATVTLLFEFTKLGTRETAQPALSSGQP